MTGSEIITHKKDILLCLSKKHMKRAFILTKEFLKHMPKCDVIDRVNQLEANYKYMLHYLFEGLEDPGRDDMYKMIQRSLYEIVDDCTDILMENVSSNVFYEKRRLNYITDLNIVDCQNKLKDISSTISLMDLSSEVIPNQQKRMNLMVQRERIASDVFNYIFISKRTDEDDYRDYSDFLSDSDILDKDKCLFVSALSLSVFHRFDAMKIKLLIEAIQQQDLVVRVRALVGLVVVMHMYDIRWNLYPELVHVMETIGEDPTFRNSFVNVIIQLIRAHGTEQVTKKVTEEIVPEMMKFNNIVGNTLKLDELMGEIDFSEKNPQWQKDIDDAGITKKLQEYSELQMSGADVFHSTFAGLKSFPFFSEVSNWFLPFDISYSQLQLMFPDGNASSIFREAIIDSVHMCNSDKYSFCFSLLQIPSSQRDLMLNQMADQSADLKQLQTEIQQMNKKQKEELYSNQYIQDLYRFFKLNNDKSSFFDIFKLSLNFYRKSSMLNFISDITVMNKIAFQCFNQNYFEEALDIYLNINEGSETINSDAIWQKIAYCYQMTGETKLALDAYLKADLISPNNSWTIKKIANTAKNLKNYNLAISYYRKAAKLHPDDMNIELNIGHCNLELQRYEESLNSYFKVEVLGESLSDKALRPIAWTSFLMKRYDVARKYYKIILSLGNNTVHDYLNAGHVELCTQKYKMALEFYKLGLVLCNNDYQKFQEIFDADKTILIEHGYNEKLYSFLFDEIQYRDE